MLVHNTRKKETRYLKKKILLLSLNIIKLKKSILKTTEYD